MDTTSVTLQKAYQLIKAGDKQQALDLLKPIAYAEPDNVQVWYLLGFAHTNPAQRIHAFERVLHLEPGNQPAQQQLAKLRNGPVAEPAAGVAVSVHGARSKPQRHPLSVRWVLTGAGILLLLLLVAGGLLFISGRLLPAAPIAKPKGAATSRPTVTPYPRRATGTPIPPTETITPWPTSTPIVLVNPLNDQDLPPIGMQTPVSYTETKSGHLEAGDDTTLRLDIDETREISFSIRWTGDQPLDIVVRAPNGETIDNATASLEAGKTTYRIPNPASGVWTIALMATAAGDYGVFGRFAKDALALSAIIWGQETIGMVDINANFEKYESDLTGVSGVALVELPNGVIEMVDLKYGRGYFDGKYQFPDDVSGSVSIHITVKGVRRGVNFTRSVRLKFFLLGNAIKLTGDYVDRIGKKNGHKILYIDIGVDSTYVGKCTVVGILNVGDQLVGGSSSEVSLVAGHNVVTLGFDMSVPRIGKLDGPYTLERLIFQQDAAAPVMMPFARNVWQTSPYHWQDFTP